MLTIENLQVCYTPGKDILKGLSLSLETEKIHGIVGLNGSGKTTLLNTLYAFLKPSGGTIHYNGRPLHRKEIGYLETENYFYPYITGQEYLDLFPEGSRSFRVETWNELFALPLRQITEDYSTGMKKKLALLAVLKMDKPVLILDEPFNGLDLETSHLLLMLLARLREKGKTILITSHIYETLVSCCDFIHYMQDGTILRSYRQENFNDLKTLLHTTIEKNAAEAIRKLF